MHAATVYSALGFFALGLHTLFIVWVTSGLRDALSAGVTLTAHRFTCLEILTELLPWRCLLTLLENWLEAKVGVQLYQGGFLFHYMDNWSIRMSRQPH